MFPQLGQNFIPGVTGVLHLGQLFPPCIPFDIMSNPAPHATHLFAFGALSAPHTGQALYGSPQKGQNFEVAGNFFAQFEQNTSFFAFIGAL